MEMIPPPVHSTFKWTGCAECTHRAEQPITGTLRAGPSGFGIRLHQWRERRGGDVCVLDSAYLGFDIHTTVTQGLRTLSINVKAHDVLIRLKLSAHEHLSVLIMAVTGHLKVV